MKFRSLIPLLVLSLFSVACFAQQKDSRIEIVEPTIEQETTSIWRTINDITFFEEQGYTIHLPEGPLIDSLIGKSKAGTFGNNDYQTLYTFVESTVFDRENYALAMAHVAKEEALISKLVNRIDAAKSTWDWEFKSFERYKIVFTLYGTGGSYDPDLGTVTLLTNKAGGFMNYENPANTIVHEITHMGMEQSLVQKFELPHGLKERLVDRFVFLLFQKELPKYQVQQMGDKKLDELVKQQSDIARLDTILSGFLGY